MWKLGTGSNRWRYSEVFGDGDQWVTAGCRKRSGVGWEGCKGFCGVEMNQFGRGRN